MSEQTDQNIEVVKRGYEAFGRGDLDAVLRLYDDNIEWTQPGSSAISGTYHGKGEIGELLRRLGAQTTMVKPLPFPRRRRHRRRVQRSDCRRRNKSRRRGLHDA